MVRTSLTWCLPAAFALAACSGGDDGTNNGNNTTNNTNNTSGADSGVEEDSGVAPLDAGPVDSGPRDCTPNPFNCVENQVREEFTCVCLEACTGGLRWNAAQGVCEEPPMGECSLDSDCNPAQACLNVPMNGGIMPCNGEATCRCLNECDPFQTLVQTGCPATADFGGGPEPVMCTWLGDPMLPEGLCLPEGTGGEQGDACMNGMGCNRNQNYFCTTTTGPGACTKLCDSTDDVLCPSLGDFSCLNLNNADFPEIGFCVAPVAPDIGTTCTSSTTCAGELCSTILGGYCSDACGGGGLDSLCASDSICITFGAGAPPGEESVCMLRCSAPDATGDAECQARNPNVICRALLPNPGDPALCAPPCTMGIGCAMGLTCDPGSGRCM